MTAGSRARFAETLRSEHPDLGLACLLVGAELHPDLDVDAALRDLDELAHDAADDVPVGATAQEAASGLRLALGDRAGFRGFGDDYDDLRASLLHEVLPRRRGLPILLSVVWLEVGRRLGVPVTGIGLPGHFVVGVAGAGSTVLVDPYNGGRLTSADELSSRTSEPLTRDDLRPWGAPEIVTRVLANIRAHAARHNALRVRLWAVELSLLVPQHSAALRRERAQLLARLGDFVGAARALEEYAEILEPADGDAATMARREAKLVRSRLS